MATACKIEVEKNVPLPDGRTGSRGPYPFSELDVGDSFFAPNTTTAKFGNRCTYYKLKYGRQFTCRKMDGGVRVWRTK